MYLLCDFSLFYPMHGTYGYLLTTTERAKRTSSGVPFLYDAHKNSSLK